MLKSTTEYTFSQTGAWRSSRRCPTKLGSQAGGAQEGEVRLGGIGWVHLSLSRMSLGQTWVG